MSRLRFTAAFLALLPVAAFAADPAPTIEITHVWARASAGASGNGAAYVTLHNTGTTADQLVAVSTDAAGKAEVHLSKMENGISSMAPVPSLEVAAGATVEMKPGSYHIMLLGLKAPLVAGQTIPLTLTFAHGGTVPTTAKIEPAGHDMKDMPGMKM
jgi:copper(I)-binding protein